MAISKFKLSDAFFFLNTKTSPARVKNNKSGGGGGGWRGGSV